MSDEPNTTETAGITLPVETPPSPPPAVEPESTSDWRPWHTDAGRASPLEALFQHFTAEIAKLSGK